MWLHRPRLTAVHTDGYTTPCFFSSLVQLRVFILVCLAVSCVAMCSLPKSHRKKRKKKKERKAGTTTLLMERCWSLDEKKKTDINSNPVSRQRLVVLLFLYFSRAVSVRGGGKPPFLLALLMALHTISTKVISLNGFHGDVM